MCNTYQKWVNEAARWHKHWRQKTQTVATPSPRTRKGNHVTFLNLYRYACMYCILCESNSVELQINFFIMFIIIFIVQLKWDLTFRKFCWFVKHWMLIFLLSLNFGCKFTGCDHLCFTRHHFMGHKPFHCSSNTIHRTFAMSGGKEVMQTLPSCVMPDNITAQFKLTCDTIWKRCLLPETGVQTIGSRCCRMVFWGRHSQHTCHTVGSQKQSHLNVFPNASKHMQCKR